MIPERLTGKPAADEAASDAAPTLSLSFEERLTHLCNGLVACSERVLRASEAVEGRLCRLTETATPAQVDAWAEQAVVAIDRGGDALVGFVEWSIRFCRQIDELSTLLWG